jgi:hypothetical protein
VTTKGIDEDKHVNGVSVGCIFIYTTGNTIEASQ